MRNAFNSFVLALSSLALLASCGEPAAIDTTPNLRKISIIAHNSLVSKTFLEEDNTIHWLDGEDRLRIFETVDGDTQVFQTEPCLLIDNEGLFEFTTEERLSESGNYYDAIYPASAWVSGSKDVRQMTLDLIDTQSPSATSFDPAADMLIAKTVHSELPKEVIYEMQFKRIVAISKMGISNLNTEDKVLSVKFGAAGRDLSGKLRVDLRESEVLSYGVESKDYVTATYSELDGFTNGSKAIFTLFPTKFQVGEQFTVEVCTSSKRYTKTFTLQESQSLEFKAGTISTFNVSMAGAAEEAVNAVANQFFVVAKHKGTYYAMSSDVHSSSKHLDCEIVALTDGKVESENPKLIWTIVEQPNGNVVLSQDGQYLKAPGEKNIAFGSPATEFKLKANEDGTYRLVNEAVVSGEKKLELRFNANSGQIFFDFYFSAASSNMIGDMLLISTGEASAISQLDAPTGLSAAVDAIDPYKVNVSWSAVANASSYIVQCDEQTIEVNGTAASFEGLSVGAHSISVCACASGYRTSSASSTSCSVTGAVAGGEDLIFSNISVSKKSNTSLSVYIYGANFDNGTNMKAYCSGPMGMSSVDASISNPSYATASFTGLTPDAEYEIYVSALDASSNTVTSETVSFTLNASAAAASKGWLELPGQTSIADTKEYALHAGEERNYSFLYDTNTRSSLWVAYPLAKGHMATGRTGSWAYCPAVPKEVQQKLSSGYSYTGEQVSRGHQIANSDRNGNATMQKQTFYFTNSTPQLQNKFNGGIWNKLEQAIQSEAGSIKDTVYIATGPVYQTVGGSESVDWSKAKDNDGKACPIPNYYFKVVMKVHRSGAAISDASAVGFWFVHKNYTDSFTNYAVSVDEIESLTGFDFFANLPEEIEAKAEANSDWDKFLAF